MMIHEILLIDDDPIANFINTKIIKNEYPELIVKKFENASIALNYIKENPKCNFQIFLDINMPGISGWEFLKTVSHIANIENLTIDILTSSVDPYDHEKAAKNPNINSFLEKPLNKDKLENLLFHKNLNTSNE